MMRARRMLRGEDAHEVGCEDESLRGEDAAIGGCEDVRASANCEDARERAVEDDSIDMTGENRFALRTKS